MKKSFEIQGTITNIYEDIGPCCRVNILGPNGGVYDFDASDLPFDSKELRSAIGKKIWVKVEAEITEE